jgi:hypothetical protein
MGAVRQQPLVGGVRTADVRRLRGPVDQALLGKERREECKWRMMAARERPRAGSIKDVPVGLVGNLVGEGAGTQARDPGTEGQARERADRRAEALAH